MLDRGMASENTAKACRPRDASAASLRGGFSCSRRSDRSGCEAHLVRSASSSLRDSRHRHQLTRCVLLLSAAAATAALARSRLQQCVTHNREPFSLRGKACRGTQSRTVRNLHSHVHGVRATATLTPTASVGRRWTGTTLRRQADAPLAPLSVSRAASEAPAPDTHSKGSSLVASPKMARELQKAHAEVASLTQANRLLFQRNEELEQEVQLLRSSQDWMARRRRAQSVATNARLAVAQVAAVAPRPQLTTLPAGCSSMTASGPSRPSSSLQSRESLPSHDTLAANAPSSTCGKRPATASASSAKRPSTASGPGHCAQASGDGVTRPSTMQSVAAGPRRASDAASTSSSTSAARATSGDEGPAMRRRSSRRSSSSASVSQAREQVRYGGSDGYSSCVDDWSY